ncbi:MAG TPA: thioesterase family protein [Kofleriaceae bacterium]|nr:thioesterase family protein [Kofleriaceae bacterium]
MSDLYRHQVRVIFGDTDQMGVVYYANYLRFFEAARAGLLRHRGGSQRDLVRWGVALPVIEAHCRYRRPSHYEDLLEIAVSVVPVRSASLRFDYQILRGEEVIADGHTVHACIGSTGRPCRIPAELRAIISDDDANLHQERDIGDGRQKSGS